LTWRGAAETLIMLVAVCGVWAFTTFEVTLLDIERSATRAVTIAVMGLGLFMNARISHAFDDGPWLFVVPLLIALVGPGCTPRPRPRRHTSAGTSCGSSSGSASPHRSEGADELDDGGPCSPSDGRSPRTTPTR